MNDVLSSFRLDGRVAIVTGAAGLIGREHCRALAAAGAIVIAADVDQQAAIDAVAELGEAHRGVMLDVTNPGSLVALRDMLLADYGRIDVLVNNAAINDMVEHPVLAAELSSFEQYPLALWKRVLDVNVTGVFLCCQVLGTVMAQRGSGSIVNIGSTYGSVAPDQSIYRTPEGKQPFFKSAAYPASKGAVGMLTRFLASYWGHAGVRVNTLSPGGVENGQQRYFIDNYSRRTPIGRMAGRSDYRGALVFLASDASSYMTGHDLVVDGGWTIW